MIQPSSELLESNLRIPPKNVPWKRCQMCKNETFNSPKCFASHLKMVHCRKEGGSYICTYGPNYLCKNLPLEGVCSKDYEIHVSRYHVSPNEACTNNVQAVSTLSSESHHFSSNSFSSQGVKTQEMNDIGLGEATTFYRRQKSAEARYYSSAAESKDAAAEENSLLMRQDDSASHTELNLQLTVHSE